MKTPFDKCDSFMYQPSASPESSSPTPTLLEIATGQNSPKLGDNPPSPVNVNTQGMSLGDTYYD